MFARRKIKMLSNPMMVSEIVLAGIAGLFVGRLLSARIIGGLISVLIGLIVLKMVLTLLLNPEPNWSLVQIQHNLSNMVIHNGIAVMVFLAGLFAGLSRGRRRNL
jgi:uncharacterized membrane protein YfcA